MKNFLSRAKHSLSKLDSKQIVSLYSRLLAEQNTMMNLLQSLPELLVICDIQGQVYFHNKHSGNGELIFYGFATKIEGKYIWECIKDKHLAKSIQKAITHDEDIDEVLTIQNDNEQAQRYIRFRTMPFVQEKKIAGTVFVVSDYTSEQSHIEELMRGGRIVSMSDISSGIAHEIKNPLAAILMHLHLIQKDLQKLIVQYPNIDITKLTKYSNIIEEECNTMNDVVSLFLHNTKKDSIDVELINLNTIIEAVLELVSPELEQNNIVLNTQLSQESVHALVAPSAIRHVLLNLLKNAIESMTLDTVIEKQSKHQDKQGTLSINTYAKENVVQIRIADTGKGVDVSIQNKIFNPYFTTKEAGTGIGLAIVEKIMQLHKGRIFLDLQYTKGACFILEFPAYAKYFLEKK